MTNVQLYHGDCLEIMQQIPDGSVGLVFADPPYGNNTEYASYDDTQENLQILIADFMPEALRIGKRVMVTCGVANIHTYPKPDWILSWVSQAGTGSGVWGFCCWQPILVYGKDSYLQAGKGRRPDTLVLTKPSEKTIHPCPKPTVIMEWIITRGSLEGDTILDPFMGSGATGIAAVNTGRNFIGIEIDKGYFDIAEKRIREAEMQPALL